MNPEPRYLRYFGCTAAALLGLTAVVNWRVDPLQLYRPAADPAWLAGPDRFRLPGIARHTKAEIAVVGTSVSRHQHPDEVARVFGKPAVNLAMDGASAHEQFLLLRLALRTGAAKEVIWDLNYEYFRGRADWVSDYDGAFPAYLYDESVWNDFANYLLSLDTAKSSARFIARRLGVFADHPRTVESFHVIPPGTRFGREAIAAAMDRRRKGAAAFRALLPQFTPEQLHASFQANCASLIREFPRVRFHLYFPPFSEAYFHFLDEIAPELLPTFLQFRREVVRAAQELPNVTLHDPQSEISLITNPARYSDPIHFDAATHTLLLEGMRDLRWRADDEQLAGFEAWLRARAQRR